MTQLEVLALIGGVIALAGGMVGSVIGIAVAASAGVATLSEDSSHLRSVIVLASLPMTQCFYGLIVLIIILTVVLPKLPDVGGSGIGVLVVGIMVGIAECISAIFQGSVCASGIVMLPKTSGQILTTSMMLAVFIELIGVLGLVAGIVAFNVLGLM